jgi:hypothetical protein
MLTFYEQFPNSHLPSLVSFVNDGFYRSYNPSTKALDVIPLSAPYDQGFTNAFYKVLETTNVAFGEIPSRFLFLAYSTPVGVGSQPFERLIVRGTTDAIYSFVRDLISTPQFSGIANVADYRISGSIQANGTNAEYNYAAYPITNSEWQLDTAALARVREKAAQRLNSQLEGQKRTMRSNSNKRLLVALVVVVNTILLAWMWWHAKQNKKAHETN